MRINIIELFSGIGGFSKGLQDAGFALDKHYFSEIDKHAIANYKYNFKNAEYIGSVTDIRGGSFTGIDVITFGSPCQDFSLAGKRKGLEGDRSSLIGEAIRLISDIRPSLFIWENVKGAFSSNGGADFWAIIQCFANIGGYRLEWQLLNTKWFLPQNRERIYLVGHLAAAERSFGSVFPIGEDGKTYFESETGTKSETQFSTAITTREGQRKENNFVIGAMRGRNPENPLSRTSGLATEQMLELNEKGTTNALTSVQKDNLVVGTWRTHKDGQGFRKVNDGNCPTIPAKAREDGSGQPVVNSENSIRRLTEIECERLQGFNDNWTKYGDYNGKIKEIPKTQRYKMLGNAVTVKVVEEIAKRLIEA